MRGRPHQDGRHRTTAAARWVVHCCREDWCCLSSASGAGQIRRNDVGEIAIQRAAGAVVSSGLPGVGMSGEVLHITQAAARIEGGGDCGCRSECGEIRLSIPAFFASRRTIRPAACRPSRLPSARASSGPTLRSPTAASIARPVRGASGDQGRLAALAEDAKHPVAVDQPEVAQVGTARLGSRSALSASRQASTWSLPPDRPAWTRNAPSSVRSSPRRVDSCDNLGRRT